jgi:hypothetical protein
LHLQQSTEDKEDSTELEVKVNLRHADFFVGAAVNHDMFTWKSVRAHAVMKEGFNKYFARFNLMEKHVSVGTTQRLVAKKGFAHSYEAFYLFNGEKGFLDQPLMFQAGGKYKVNNKSKIEYTVEASNVW